MNELVERRKAGEINPVISNSHLANYQRLLEELNETIRPIESHAVFIAENLNKTNEK